ncbi:hypothetical protein FRC17_004110 [Serendipita sp. 399]|nr:hypothetical protein FRC17_004110 [Serendipita sp. 399]
MQVLRAIYSQNASILRIPAGRSARLISTTISSSSTGQDAPASGEQSTPDASLFSRKDDVSGEIEPAQNTARSSSGSSLWETLADTLEESRRTANHDRFIETPEQAWKRKSITITNGLHSSGGGVALNVTRNLDNQPRPIHQVPTVASGRTVHSTNFALAIQRLGSILARNKVKQEWRRDRYFEKGPAKRYRLRSERHRRRFAAMVRRYVQIVQSIKRRGM